MGGGTRESIRKELRRKNKNRREGMIGTDFPNASLVDVKDSELGILRK